MPSRLFNFEGAEGNFGSKDINEVFRWLRERELILTKELDSLCSYERAERLELEGARGEVERLAVYITANF